VNTLISVRRHLKAEPCSEHSNISAPSHDFHVTWYLYAHGGILQDPPPYFQGSSSCVDRCACDRSVKGDANMTFVGVHVELKSRSMNPDDERRSTGSTGLQPRRHWWERQSASAVARQSRPTEY